DVASHTLRLDGRALSLYYGVAKMLLRTQRYTCTKACKGRHTTCSDAGRRCGATARQHDDHTCLRRHACRGVTSCTRSSCSRIATTTRMISATAVVAGATTTTTRRKRAAGREAAAAMICGIVPKIGRASCRERVEKEGG